MVRRSAWMTKRARGLVSRGIEQYELRHFACQQSIRADGLYRTTACPSVTARCVPPFVSFPQPSRREACSLSVANQIKRNLNFVWNSIDPSPRRGPQKSRNIRATKKKFVLAFWDRVSFAQIVRLSIAISIPLSATHFGFFSVLCFLFRHLDAPTESVDDV